LDGILEVCELVRGVYVVVQAAVQWINTGPLKPILAFDFAIDASELPQDVMSALQAVKDCIIASTTADTTSVYISALQVLQQSFTVSVEQPTMVLVWLVLIERQFVVMLRERDPVALVMLAHYGVLLYSSRQHWWCGDWGVVIVKNVHQVLNDEWRPLIAWPVQKVGLCPSV
jgi:hypothetical protein